MCLIYVTALKFGTRTFLSLHLYNRNFRPNNLLKNKVIPHQKSENWSVYKTFFHKSSHIGCFYTYSHIIIPLVITIYSKTFVVFMVFHSTTNFFLQIMALSISNISLQQCYSKSLPWIAIFHSKRKSSPPQMFSCIWYVTSLKVPKPY